MEQNRQMVEEAERHNTSQMFQYTKFRCQCCKPCWNSEGGDGRHTVHDQGRLAYTGPKTQPLSPTLSDGEKVDGRKKEGQDYNQERRISSR